VRVKRQSAALKRRAIGYLYRVSYRQRDSRIVVTAQYSSRKISLGRDNAAGRKPEGDGTMPASPKRRVPARCLAFRRASGATFALTDDACSETRLLLLRLETPGAFAGLRLPIPGRFRRAVLLFAMINGGGCCCCCRGCCCCCCRCRCCCRCLLLLLLLLLLFRRRDGCDARGMSRAKFSMTFPIASLMLLRAIEGDLATRAPQQFFALVADHANHLCTCLNTMSIGRMRATYYRPGHVSQSSLCCPTDRRRHLHSREESHARSRVARSSATPSYGLRSARSRSVPIAIVLRSDQ